MLEHGSDQTLTPKMHAQVELLFDPHLPPTPPPAAEPNPRYQLRFTPPRPDFTIPNFALTYNASCPSLAVTIGHRLAFMLDLPLDWYDMHTGRSCRISCLRLTDPDVG